MSATMRESGIIPLRGIGGTRASVGGVARREVRGAPSPHRISLRLRLDFFDSPSRGE